MEVNIKYSHEINEKYRKFEVMTPSIGRDSLITVYENLKKERESYTDEFCWSIIFNSKHLDETDIKMKELLAQFDREDLNTWIRVAILPFPGLGRLRRHCLYEAVGKYVMFFDDDDTFDNGFIKDVIEAQRERADNHIYYFRLGKDYYPEITLESNYLEVENMLNAFELGQINQYLSGLAVSKWMYLQFVNYIPDANCFEDLPIFVPFMKYAVWHPLKYCYHYNKMVPSAVTSRSVGKTNELAMEFLRVLPSFIDACHYCGLEGIINNKLIQVSYWLTKKVMSQGVI